MHPCGHSLRSADITCTYAFDDGAYGSFLTSEGRVAAGITTDMLHTVHAALVSEARRGLRSVSKRMRSYPGSQGGLLALD